MTKAALALLTCFALSFPEPGDAADVPAKTIGVLIYDGVLSSDVTAPLEVFGNAVKQKEFPNYRVVAVAPEKRPVTTEEGIVLMPQFSIDDAPALDTLIVGSAYDMDRVLGNARLIEWISARGKAAKWLASNCSGARLLGDAGLLVGRRATTYPGGELLMKARYLRTTVVFGEKVVVDGNLVTSNGGVVSYTAALKLLELMTNAAFADKVAANIEYDRVAPAAHRVTATKVTPLMKKDLGGKPEQTAEMLTVEYAPGASTPSHRHDANVFVYVIDGTLNMQVAGQQEVTLKAGDTFYENPSDVHVKSANASANESAKFLVLKLANKP
jgi:putative intracellular protease/amidase/quercetin dioxygenase-like cupin family protein